MSTLSPRPPAPRKSPSAGSMAVPRCPAGLALLLLLLGACGFFQSYAVEVDLKDASNVTCLYAQWMMKFLIKYETNSSDYKNASLELTSPVTHNGSVCGNDTQAALVAVQFGDGHSWSINFTKNNETYQAEFITFTYNTGDTAVFPDAKRQGPVTIVVKDGMHPIQLNDVFVCHHTTFFEVENVMQIFWNVTVQPFVQNGTIGKKEFRCHTDTPTSAPTVLPTVANVTTASTTISPAPTTTAKPAENPVTGNYSLKTGNKTCLLATVGLQLNVSRDKHLLINIDPKTTRADGTCGNTSATLKLNDGNKTLIDFTFIVNASVQKFYLKEVNVTLLNHQNGSVILTADNNNFTKWDASLGNSYMCHKEQTLEINEDLQVHTFNLWVQPFLVKENKFSIAEDCSPEVDYFIVPIAVGAALGGLVVLVIMAYFLGHKKQHNAGYEQF
ncbi:lysosome-associated membrane glycoprotein 2 isoform X1 [Numida meleagris]|uniref:lysosome-associated membrane glycoprotein 2 isoform X1 n=1 Tax=Numida meleagris TaxID=8996 RepID=UPI000B3D9EA4|nr:lysosome-associated membrane glycoprotein 2 isoform X1 [Numida meleagris]